ncbi:MAG: signal peptidase II [Ruminococcaceae bacterium]|nr:signal peptidase II [Oscillospiraceae bacterium]
MLFTIVVSALLIAADQFTKFLAVTYLAPVGTMPLIPGVMQLQFILNDGMAFSMLSGNRWFLVTVTGIALVALLIYLLFRRPKNKLEYFAWLLILSGGIGTLIDRIFSGYVVDFFAVQFVQFAVFNVADCYVTIGAAMLIIWLIFGEIKAYREKKAKLGDTNEGN